MNDLILARVLDVAPLFEQISQSLDLGNARLIRATSRPIDADGYLSDIVGVTLEWDTKSAAPIHAVLKVSHAGFGQAELPFYQTIATRLNCPVVPQFFAGGIDEPTGRTWVLIEDLSKSHELPSQAPLPPTFARSTQLVEALAKFHAAGWGNGSWQGMSPTLGERLRSSEWLEMVSGRLLAQAGDAVNEQTRDLYARFTEGFPALVARVEQMRGKTLVHGDAHVWNWMLPREGLVEVPKLVDWDGWHIGIGAWDLAYMMALQWDPDVRQRFESALLDRYHRALETAGVNGYSRTALQEDYRLAVLLHLRTPIARYMRNMSAYVWWPQLTRIQHAVKDLCCLDLLT